MKKIVLQWLLFLTPDLALYARPLYFKCFSFYLEKDAAEKKAQLYTYTCSCDLSTELKQIDSSSNLQKFKVPVLLFSHGHYFSVDSAISSFRTCDIKGFLWQDVSSNLVAE